MPLLGACEFRPQQLCRGREGARAPGVQRAQHFVPRPQASFAIFERPRDMSGPEGMKGEVRDGTGGERPAFSRDHTVPAVRGQRPRLPSTFVAGFAACEALH